MPTKSSHEQIRNATVTQSCNRALIKSSYDVLSTPSLLSSSGPTNGRPDGAAELCICPLSLISAESSERPGAVKGAVCARRSEPLTARTVLEHGAEGKAGGGLRGCPPGGVRGSAPRTLPRAFFARGIKNYRRCLDHAASASTKLGKSSKTQLFFSVR